MAIEQYHLAEKRLVELRPVLAAQVIDDLQPANSSAGFSAALLVIQQNREEVDVDERFDEISTDFFASIADLVSQYSGTWSKESPQRLVAGRENVGCFWFQGPVATPVAAAQAILTSFADHAAELHAVLRIAIGRHGYAASRLALLASPGDIGFDSALFDGLSAADQEAIRRLVVTDPTFDPADLKKLKKKFEKGIEGDSGYRIAAYAKS